MLPVQWWPNHGLAALELGVPDIQSAAAGAWSNPRVVSKLQMKWNAPERVPLVFTRNLLGNGTANKS